jgi:hypothetical protein
MVGCRALDMTGTVVGNCMPTASQEKIGPAKITITANMNAGYWQVPLKTKSKDKTASFTPNAEKHWTRLPMGILNAHSFYVCMMKDFKAMWDQNYKTNPRKFIEQVTGYIQDNASTFPETEVLQEQTKLQTETHIQIS